MGDINNHEVFNLLNRIREAQERSEQSSLSSFKPGENPISTPSVNDYPTPNPPANTYRQPPPINPAEISTYSAAVKYAAKYISQDQQILSRIRLLIEDQERHEKEWSETREAIIRRQNDRQSGRQKLESILKLVGGADNEASAPSNSDPQELAAYDYKVYKSGLKLIENHKEQLRELRIPLFCSNSPPSSEEDQKKLMEFLKDIAC